MTNIVQRRETVPSNRTQANKVIFLLDFSAGFALRSLSIWKLKKDHLYYLSAGFFFHFSSAAYSKCSLDQDAFYLLQQNTEMAETVLILKPDCISAYWTAISWHEQVQAQSSFSVSICQATCFPLDLHHLFCEQRHILLKMPRHRNEIVHTF